MISVVIPALDEEKRLPSCLAALLPQAAAHSAEVIVVDGGSRDGTREIARREPVRMIESDPGRGIQMNRGALESSGSLLVFLPADTLLPDGAIRRLAEIDRSGKPVAGGFRHRFDRRRPVLRAVSALHNLRARITGVIYGDQVPFLSRRLFFGAGGFREDIDMEDVEFGARVRRLIRPRLVDMTVTTAARRFDRFGDLRATANAAGVLACWTFFRRIPRSRTFFTPVR